MECIATGTLPLKYAYAGSAARTHDELARSNGYLEVIGSATLEADALGCLRHHGDPPTSFVEIGPGNGVHTAALLSQLRGRDAPFTSYLGLDFSETLLRICQAHLDAASGRDTAIEVGSWDVESAPTSLITQWRGGPGPLVVGLLGQTLGNVEDISITLNNIHASMAAGDVLAVTVALLREGAGDEEVLAPYRTPAFRSAVLEPLRSAGLDVGVVDLSVRIHDTTVVGEVLLRADASIGEQVLPAGHRVRCFLSRRFSAGEVLKMFDMRRWSPRCVFFDDEGQHAVVISLRKT